MLVRVHLAPFLGMAWFHFGQAVDLLVPFYIKLAKIPFLLFLCRQVSVNLSLSKALWFSEGSFGLHGEGGFSSITQSLPYSRPILLIGHNLSIPGTENLILAAFIRSFI
jgi:hypothetical protein